MSIDSDNTIDQACKPSARFKATLEQNLLEAAKELSLGLRCTLKHDNNPKYTDTIMNTCFRSKLCVL